MRFKIGNNVLCEDFVTIKDFVFEKVSREGMDGMITENRYKAALNGGAGYAKDLNMMQERRKKKATPFEDSAWLYCTVLKTRLGGKKMIITNYWDKGYDVGFTIEHDGYQAQIDIHVRDNTRYINQRIIW